MMNGVSITAGTTDIASYHTNGGYSADPGLFSAALNNGALTAPSSESSGGNGGCAYGGSSLFPTIATTQQATAWTSCSNLNRRLRSSDKMHEELYADGVTEITVGESIVRVDLFTLSPLDRDAANAPKKAFRRRRIFPAQGFASAVDVMQRALQGLVEAGIVKRGPPHFIDLPPINSTDECLSTSTAPPRSPNASSNFR